MVKRTTKTKKVTRSNLRAAAQNQRVTSLDQAWDLIKADYDPDIVALVDGAMDHGFSYQDLLKLEMLEHMRLDKAIRHFLRQPKTSTLVQSLASVKLQCRKHIRTILASLGPGLNLGDHPVRVPEGMDPARLDAIRREILELGDDEIMS
jgi:hypothetical protein